MFMRDQIRPDHRHINGAHTLTRHNLEFAAIVVYFFSLAVFVVLTLIVMLMHTGDETNARAANHQPEVRMSVSDLR